MPRLSVNLNKIALLRNARRTGVPDLLRFAEIAQASGAAGITVHPRPDERHIRGTDVPALARLMAPWRPGFELNIEGYPDSRFLDLVRAVQPEQTTLVPDGPGVLTSEEGWRLDATERALVEPAILALKALGSRVILFVDPDPGIVETAQACGADGIEIYTGAYATAFRVGQSEAAQRASAEMALRACAETARRARALGLVVNIGHDLNLDNLPALIAALPQVAEASIGHELTADALTMGFAGAVRAYRAALGDATG